MSNFSATARGISMWASVRDCWRTYNPYLAALAIFGSSRLVVIWALYIVARIVLPAHPAVLTIPFASTSWYQYLLRWDSAWYATILNEGYKYNGNDLVQQSVNFYPLYPLIAKVLTIFPGIDGLFALLVVANVAAVLSMLLLFTYVRQDHGDEAAFLTERLLRCALGVEGAGESPTRSARISPRNNFYKRSSSDRVKQPVAQRSLLN